MVALENSVIFYSSHPTVRVEETTNDTNGILHEHHFSRFLHPNNDPAMDKAWNSSFKGTSVTRHFFHVKRQRVRGRRHC